MNWIKIIKLAFQLKKALEDSKVWYPPVCIICHEPWSIKSENVVECPHGHRLSAHGVPITVANAGNHHGDL